MKKIIKKSIAFVYTDKGEYLLYESIADEAASRGYKIRYTDNILDTDEIVFYCQHVCYPHRKNKLSIIMLHDLGQQRGIWPNIWIKENWNKFDIGFLPNKEWADMWTDASGLSFVNPKLGCFEVGWPKADKLNDEKFKIEANLLAERIGLDRSKKTVLYAPSWENDNKQLDFVNSFKDEDVNMLIKQFPCSENNFPDIYKNIIEMEKQCRGVKNLYILNPETNIFTAILLSDILVSEESSTLIEAVLAGKLSVSVTDWPIPDTYPSRMPVAQPDYIIKTEKKELKNTINNILQNYTDFQKDVYKYRDDNFKYIGNTGKNILDIIDACVENDLEKILLLRSKRNKKKLHYSIKIRNIWKITYYKSLLALKYSRPDSNIIMHTLYKIYKKCRHK